MSVQLLQAKLFLTMTVNVVSAAADAFLAHPPIHLADGTLAAVSTTLAALRSAVTDLQNAEATADWRSIATEVVVAVEHLIPIVFPMLGAWAGFLPLAIGIVKNFLMSIPASTTHPQEPPHAMVAAATSVTEALTARTQAGPVAV